MIFIRNNLFALLISLLFWTCTFIPFDASAERLVQNKNQYHANLWDRIRSGFALALPPDSKAIRKIEALYAQNPEAFNRIVASSERYLYYIVDEIERRDMPMEIALLPVIESAYNPMNKSHRQAVGLWQFIPATGKVLGLAQNVWHDDRRDIVASTQAALDYLQYLYKKFNNWKLAIAAYNLGEGAVSKILAKSVHKGRAVNFYDLNLPTEVKNYVFRLLAVKDLIVNSKKYGIKLRPVPNRPYFDTVQIREPIDISLVTRLANISEAEFNALNPAYNRYVIRVMSEPRTLLLPRGNKEIFLKNLETYQDPKVSWQFYRVKKDENIHEIATRFGTTVKQLQAINGISRNKNLTLGQKILVPQAIGEIYAENTAHRKKQLQNYRSGVYIVRKGDTLSEIAKRHGTTVDQIKLWNDSDENLSIGQKLQLSRS